MLDSFIAVVYDNSICSVSTMLHMKYNVWPLLHDGVSTQTADGSVNQLPPWTEVQGDIRLTPFYDVDKCMKDVEGYVADLNKGLLHCNIPYIIVAECRHAVCVMYYSTGRLLYV